MTHFSFSKHIPKSELCKEKFAKGSSNDLPDFSDGTKTLPLGKHGFDRSSGNEYAYELVQFGMSHKSKLA